MSESFAKDFDKDTGITDEFKPPEEITRRFEVTERLAENDMGETFLLVDRNDGRKFILKCYRKPRTAAETRESEILRELNHSGLPKFEAEVEDGDSLFVLREYAQGVPLTAYMDDLGGVLVKSQAINIAMQICDILTYLHSQPVPIIHRDVKPSNIIVDADNLQVKLIDFGISRRFSKDADTDTTYFGTKKFSPPEQYGFTQTDARADIYALGVVLKYMLTGTPDGEVFDKGLARITEKCTAFSPNDRYKSAAALKKDLVKHGNDKVGKVRKTVASVLVMCAVFALGFGGGWYAHSMRDNGNVLVDEPENVPVIEQTSAPTTEPTSEPATELISEPITEPVSVTEIAEDDNEDITFIEPLIEDAVRYMLGKADDEPLYQSDLNKVSGIYINGNKIAQTYDEFHQLFEPGNYGTIEILDDIRMLPNIRALYLNAQPLTDVSPLVDCLMLDNIKFEDCPITDVSVLKELPSLTWLAVFGCRLEDVSYFAEFGALYSLSLGSMPQIDFSQLNAPQIHDLNVGNSALMSLEELGLERFPRLEQLALVGTFVDDFSLLDEFPNITCIFINQRMVQYLHTMTRDDIEVVVD